MEGYPSQLCCIRNILAKSTLKHWLCDTRLSWFLSQSVKLGLLFKCHFLVSARGDKASSPLATMQISVVGSASKMHRAVSFRGRLLGQVQRSRHLSPISYKWDSQSQGEASETLSGTERHLGRNSNPKFTAKSLCLSQVFHSCTVRSLACVLLWWSLSLNKENQSLEDY